MFKQMRNKKYNKKAISLMLSYVLLISMVIVTSAAVYLWMKDVMTGSSSISDCEEETSLILENYICDNATNLISFNFKNNGRFNVNGVVIKISNETDRYPVIILKKDNYDSVDMVARQGKFVFDNPLKPEDSIFLKLKNQDVKDNTISTIKRISMQPFITDEKTKEIILCTQLKIEQEIDNCNI
jgi:hypothetical protein